VSVVGHHYSNTRVTFCFVIVATAGQDDVAGVIFEDAAILCNEGYKVGFGVALETGEFAAVEGHSRALSFSLRWPRACGLRPLGRWGHLPLRDHG
jgi:hypothetical protein